MVKVLDEELLMRIWLSFNPSCFGDSWNKTLNKSKQDQVPEYNNQINVWKEMVELTTSCPLQTYNEYCIDNQIKTLNGYPTMLDL